MPDTLRIGIIGAGGIVEQRHLPGFVAINGVEIRAVANRSRESSQAVADRWHIPVVCDDWQELVVRDDLDAVAIGTWPYLHCEATLAALSAGKHVFCQARMAANLAEARAMYEAAALSDRVTALCPPPHVMAVDRWARALLADGLLGELRLMRLTALSDGAVDEARPPTWRERAAWSGQQAMTLGIWAEIVRGWCGETRELVASTHTFVAERPNPSGGSYAISIPDSVSVLSNFAKGGQGVWQISTIARNAPPERLELFGSAGTLAVDSLDAALWINGERREVPPEWTNPWAVEANFVSAVREGKPVLTSFLDGLRYMEFVAAVHRSQSVGSWIRLPLSPL